METFFRMITPRPKPPPETYNYFSAPDGEDTSRKLRYMIRNSGLLGLGLAASDAILCSRHLQTHFAMAKRFAYIACPIMAAGGIFTWSSNALGTFKEKYSTVERRNIDDVAASSAWNWGLSAALASFTSFAWINSVAHVLLLASSAGLTVYVIRYADIVGYKILGDFSKKTWTSGHDYTLTAEREKNWTAVVPTEQE